MENASSKIHNKEEGEGFVITKALHHSLFSYKCTLQVIQLEEMG